MVSQGDSLHLLSNGKDQIMKYWDIRQLHPLEIIKNIPPLNRVKSFDYRYCQYPTEKYTKHPCDCSIHDFVGHSVLATLIRCDFSPIKTTGQRYVYTGSSDGVVRIFDLESTEKVQELNAEDN